jgi:hypothetical protein
MKSDYVFEKNDNYMTLVISGEYDKNDFLSYPKLILEKCENENVDKILVDGSNLRGTNIPTMDRFFIAENIANLLRARVKLAVVWPKEHINRFAETVAVNRGSSMIVVDTIDAAHQWLLSED